VGRRLVVTKYYAGVTVYECGNNLVPAAWSAHAGNPKLRRALNAMSGEELPFYVDVQGHTGFVEYEQAKQFPVPSEVLALVRQVGLGFVDNYAKSGSGLLLPSLGNA
jgi:hypothetical protein